MKGNRCILIGLSLFFTTIFNYGYGQLLVPDTITMSGVVLDADSLYSLPNVHIRTNKNKGTITNSDGQFSFRINVGDTLTFSYIGYENLTYLIPDTLKYNNYMMGIILNRDTIMLSEIIILPWMNKAQFKNAFINAPPDQNTANASLNLDMMGYTSRAYAPTWGTLDMVEYQLNLYTESVEYKGMISPSQSFNIIGFTSYLVYLSHQQLTKDEKQYRLRQELRQYIQQQQKNEE